VRAGLCDLRIALPVLWGLALATAQAQTYSVLHRFGGGDGGNPRARLVLSGSTLYGTTWGDSGPGNGVMFKVNTDGSGYSVLRRFSGGPADSSHPLGLVLAGSTLYGTASAGGSSGGGAVFKVNTDGSGCAELKSFTGEDGDGADPYAGLVLAGSTLYGTMPFGGSSGGGVVFKVNTDGSGYAVLKDFTGTDGSNSFAGLLLAGSTLYGTTCGGGASNLGVVFKLNTNGSGYAVLKSFTGSDGSKPQGDLVLGGATLYGTTSAGGALDDGVVFRVNTDGSGYGLLRSFTYVDGAGPQAGLVLVGSALYGTTAGGGDSGLGVVFQVNTDGSGYLVLKNLETSDGAAPQADLVFSGTTLFGSACYEGGNLPGLGNWGTLFSVSLAPAFLEAPLSQTVWSGTNVELTAQATGAPVLAYRWYFNGRSAIRGATNAYLGLNDIQRSQSGAYTLVVTNQFGAVTSARAVLEVLAVAPRLETAPLSQAAAVGSNAVFSVAASGSLPLSYQWYDNGTHAIHGAVNPSLLLTNLQLAQAGAYSVRVANPVGAVISSPAKLTVYGLAPTLVSPPSGNNVGAGATVEFSVAAAGSPPLRYRWFVSGTNAIAGGTNSLLRLVNVQPSQTGLYNVRVTNAFGAVTSAPVLLSVVPAGVVAHSTEADLRLAMAQGGRVTFAGDGTITLTNTITVELNTELDGSGHQVTISGNGAVRVFAVNTNVSFTVSNLTIADGTSVGGSAILNLGGTVNLAGVTFNANTATIGYNFFASTNDDLIPRAGGGAIFNRGGTVNATNCSFADNAAWTPPPFWDVDLQVRVNGGAIRNESGQVALYSCAFTGNRASGGGYSPPMMQPVELAAVAGFGGAIHNSGTATLDLCTLAGNSASGGTGSGDPTGLPGAEGSGGAIWNEGTLTVDRTTLSGNTGTGGNGGQGWASSYPPGNLNGYPGGNGAGANGGAICNLGSLWVARSTIASNVVTGGAGGAGGPYLQFNDIHGSAGPSGNGGSGLGGAVFTSGSASFVNCTIAFNTGSGWGGGFGGGSCGGIEGTRNLTNCTIAWNAGSLGLRGLDGGGTLVNNLFVANAPPGGDSFSDPKLGPLADNGGPTLTMALLPGSPAIDAGETALAPATDQRGFPRPVGLAADLGAFELGPLAPLILTPPMSQTAPIGSTVDLVVDAAGTAPLGYRWLFDGTYAPGSATNSVLELANVQPSRTGTYAVVVTNALGAVTSPAANLTVMAVPPGILIPPTNQAAAAGSTVDFAVSAGGSMPLSYQWFFDGSNALAGATDPVLELANVLPSQSGSYSVLVTNAFGAVTSSAALLTLTAPGTKPVAYCTEAALRAALSGGGRVVFACDGAISLGQTIMIATNTALDGNGHSVTVSGGNAVGVFDVLSGVTFSLANLTIANGRSSAGGGLRNEGGSVSATNCIFCGNAAYGTDGAIGASGTDGSGGAIHNTGSFNASQCAFVGNTAQGGQGDGGGRPAGGSGGAGNGGAVCSSGAMVLERSLLASNSVAGGSGGDGPRATGQDPIKDAGAGWGGSAGPGYGGAVCNSGTAALINCTLAFNNGTAGGGGLGGNSVFMFVPGAPGGPGGTGAGAIYTARGQLNLTNCTIASNFGQGGSGGNGGSGQVLAAGGDGGDGVGGICNNGGTASLINCLLADNSGVGGGGGYGGSTGPGPVVDTNAPAGLAAGNFLGAFSDLGHNLSSDSSFQLTGSGSLTGVDPGLAPLLDNGGPTWTMALLPSSPAIDAGDTAAAPPTDQRGFPRPVGSAADIGAFEYGYPAVLRVSRAAGPGVDLVAYGVRGQTVRLLTSPDLSSWTPLSTNQIGSDGALLFHLDTSPSSRFYRLELQ